MTTTPAPALLRWSERLDRRAGLAFALLAAVAFLGLLYLGRHATFFQDEWSFIPIGGWGTLADWFAPHNEHWSTLPFAAYRLLLNTIGLQSYLPYLALLLALHVLTASAIFVLVRRASGALLGLAFGGLFLVLGSGYQNLFWAFQIGFVGSVAFGLWAFVALDHGRALLAAALLLAACACSSMGLMLVGAAIVELAVERRYRVLRWVAAIVAVYLVWFLVIGHTGLTTEGTRAVRPLNVEDIPAFIFVGTTGAAGATVGVGRPGGIILVAVLVAVWVGQLARGRVVARALGFGAALLAMFTLIALGRAGFGLEWALRSRYIYVAAALLMVGGASVIGRVVDLPALLGGASGRSRALSLGVLALTGVLVATGLVYNLGQLRYGARWFAEAAGVVRATIEIADTYGTSVPYSPPPSTPFLIPQPDRLNTAIATWGSLTGDVLVPSVVRAPTKAERDQALWRLYGGLTAPVPATAPAGAPPLAQLLGQARPGAGGSGAPPVLRAIEGTASEAGSCVVLRRDAGSTGTMSLVVEVPDGGSLAIATDRGGSGSLRLGRLAMPAARDQLAVDYPASSWLAVTVPHLGDGHPFSLQLRLPDRVQVLAACGR